MKILVKREAAHGDVLVAAAILPALKKKFNCEITFYSKCLSVLYNNKYLDYVSDKETILNDKFDRIIDLDLAYEKRPYCNILQAYAEVAGVPLEDCEMYLYGAPVNMPLFLRYVVIHAGTTDWVGRNWQHDKMCELALRIKDAGLQIVCVGTKKDKFIPCDADVRDRATVNETATIIKGSKLFIGIDSLPMHIAQAVGTPGVVFFGSISPSTRIINQKIEAVVAKNLKCLGCHHRKPAPAFVTNVCEYGNIECEHLVSVDEVFERVMNKLN